MNEAKDVMLERELIEEQEPAQGENDEQ